METDDIEEDYPEPPTCWVCDAFKPSQHAACGCDDHEGDGPGHAWERA